MAPEGVLRHVHPLGDSQRRCVADGGARGPKVLPAAELEGILAGLIVAVPFFLFDIFLLWVGFIR